MMISDVDIISKKVEDLKKSIHEIDAELGVVENYIDSLECYPNQQNKLDELYEESDKLEDSKKAYMEELEALEDILKSIEKLGILESRKAEIEQLMRDDPSRLSDGQLFFELGSIKQDISYNKNKVNAAANKIKNNNKKRKDTIG